MYLGSKYPMGPFANANNGSTIPVSFPVLRPSSIPEGQFSITICYKIF